jgi:hypothetical protein
VKHPEPKLNKITKSWFTATAAASLSIKQPSKNPKEHPVIAYKKSVPVHLTRA